MMTHPAVWLLVGLACLGVPLVDDVYAMVLMTVSIYFWQSAAP